MTSPLILVDGSSYFFRAFHALPPLTNSKGQPTGAIYGVVNMVKRLIKDYQSERVVVIFDAPGKTFRNDWYPEYKAHRPPTPPDLSSQFKPMVDVLKAMGLPLLIIDGVEADDVIGTLACLASACQQPVIISTGDKDMAQLVNEHVTLINTMTNQLLDTTGVKDKFGVMPAQIIDYLTLVGDSADNIPGVTKCGPKTAVKWLEQYQTLDNLLANSATITGKIGEYLREAQAHLPLSKQLVTIKTDVPLPLTLEQLHLGLVDTNVLIALTKELEFKSWLNELLANHQNDVPIPDVAPIAFSLITTHQELATWLDKLTSCQQFCIDTETTSLDVMQANIVGISLAIDPEHPIYIPLGHNDGTPQLPRDEVLAKLKPILENPAIGKIGQNLKYDYNVFKQHGITLCGIIADTMLNSYVLNSINRHDMDSMALKYLGHKTISFEDVAGKGAKQLRFDMITVAKAAAYAAEDAAITLKLHHTLYPLLDETLKPVLNDIDIPLLTVLADIERQGVMIDVDKLATHGKRLKSRLNELHDAAIALAGRPFNLNSPKQLQEILFNEQQLPIISKTPGGQPSTAEAVLQELAFEYELPKIILEYRGLSKLVSTYIDALPKRQNPQTGRIHTSYNQAITATGRLSSSEPNLQNIPIRSDEGRLIRAAFIAPKDSLIVAADYSQIELRIMAHLSADKSLLSAFANQLDIHTATASEIFQVALDEVSSEQRRRAKAVNFGLIYGMSAFGLAKQLGIDRHEAQRYIDCYFARYPGVLEYMERTRALAHQQGYVETLSGRRLYLPDINARNIMRQKASERMAINAPMQGTAADIIKKAMLAIAAWCTDAPDNGVTMIMQVHDELVFEVAKNQITNATTTIQRLMENTTTLAVPLNVSIGIGANWDEAH